MDYDLTSLARDRPSRRHRQHANRLAKATPNACGWAGHNLSTFKALENLLTWFCQPGRFVKQVPARTGAPMKYRRALVTLRQRPPQGLVRPPGHAVRSRRALLTSSGHQSMAGFSVDASVACWRSPYHQPDSTFFLSAVGRPCSKGLGYRLRALQHRLRQNSREPTRGDETAGQQIHHSEGTRLLLRRDLPRLCVGIRRALHASRKPRTADLQQARSVSSPARNPLIVHTPGAPGDPPGPSGAGKKAASRPPAPA